MKHTLEDLKAGKLYGSKSLKLTCGLKEFPIEILSLADTLEFLDLSDNDLSELPESISQLKRLRILFFQNNKFKKFPKVLNSCTSLSMVGFKSNQIETIPENCFPPLLRWLTLTNNNIKSIPKSIGDCERLQKFLISGNCIKEIPLELKKCKNLELLRISSNQLTLIPNWVFMLPKLSWVAFGGNPIPYQIIENSTIVSYDWNDFSVKERLGEGASGYISKATHKEKNNDVAIKVFKGAVTSDGLPEDEMKASIAAGKHKNLIEIIGNIKNHPEEKRGLIMKLIPLDFVNLGNPPSLESCTRDVYDNNLEFDKNDLFKIAKSMASVCLQLHSKGINHGDFYAHNILINSTKDCLLGDFGAASFYDVASSQARLIERVEVRAFGCLLEELLMLVNKKSLTSMLLKKWQKLVEDCTGFSVELRPSFSEVVEKLSSFEFSIDLE